MLLGPCPLCLSFQPWSSLLCVGRGVESEFCSLLCVPELGWCLRLRKPGLPHCPGPG